MAQHTASPIIIPFQSYLSCQGDPTGQAIRQQWSTGTLAGGSVTERGTCLGGVGVGGAYTAGPKQGAQVGWRSLLMRQSSSPPTTQDGGCELQTGSTPRMRPQVSPTNGCALDWTAINALAMQVMGCPEADVVERAIHTC